MAFFAVLVLVMHFITDACRWQRCLHLCEPLNYTVKLRPDHQNCDRCISFRCNYERTWLIKKEPG
jgi:hypothetical protein